MAHSLRTRLLAWVVLPLAGAVAVDGWISHANADAAASVVQDRLLLGSARIVAEQLRFEDGAIQEHIPPAALELFESAGVDRVYYRVTARDGQTVTGYSELAVPAVDLQPETGRFFDSTVRQEAVRAVVYLQPVLTDSGAQPVRVAIAQTLHGHRQLTDSLWLQSMVQQLVILALVALFVLFGLRNCLEPLLRLRNAVLARQPGSLRPLEVAAIPAELAPLVEAINEYARRLDQYTTAQQVFIQNAAHQLRTPLTLLNTQVSYALRAADGAGRSESLAAIRLTVQQSVRMVNQLLTLSAAQSRGPGETMDTPVALDAVVRLALEDLAGHAHAKDIDLGFEMVGQGPCVAADAVGVREISLNLIENAIRYTPAGGVVTCRISTVARTVQFTVEDNGPGIPVSERERVFERFYRIHNGDSGGSGLGLPIVRELAVRMRAEVALRTPESGLGLAVDVTFVRATEPEGAHPVEPAAVMPP